MIKIMESHSTEPGPSSLTHECNCAIESILKQSLGSRSFNEKCDIINKGRPTPHLKNLKSKASGGYDRHFNPIWYTEYPWLCGCTKFSKVFCWPCLLFSTGKSAWNSDGVGNMENFRIVRGRHENSKQHISSVCALAKFGNTRIDFSLSNAFKQSIEKYNENVKRNRYIMERLISATCFLAQQELPFRGNNESSESVNKGNYVELLNLLAETDDKLLNHLQTATVFSGTSNDIQNDIIECISRFMINKIKEEVNNSNFVAVIMDETTDVSNKSQLSTIFRYVTSDGKVEERFLGFSDVSSNRTAARLSLILSEHIDQFQCGEKLVAQTYDGAPVMAGSVSGLQTLVKQKYSEVLFVHCCAHRLNLVLEKSVDCIKECKVFFQTVSGLSSFFTKSSSRTNTLDREFKKRLPTVSNTRWNYRSRMIDVIFNFKEELSRLFKSMGEDSEKWDGETRACAVGYYQNLQSFDFNFLLEVFSSVFPKSDVLFSILQKKIFDVGYCKKKISDFFGDLTTLRDSFDRVWQKMESLDKVEEALRPKRLRLNDVGTDKKASYRRLFYEIIDTLKVQMTAKFSDINKLEFLALLDSEKYADFAKTFPEKAFQVLVKNYGRFFNIVRLKNELLYVYSSPEFRAKSVYELSLELRAIGLTQALLEVTKLCALILTIPATSASAERTFSALRRIHTYQRNTQGQNRLSGLSLISIEKSLLQNLKKKPTFYDSIIDLFLEKNRRIELKYK